jgi:hypothetical protein
LLPAPKIAYNLPVPTPFYHLARAEDLLREPRLAESARRWLNAERPAFLLGNVAPDVQTVSGQTREATHFFSVPMRGDLSAHETMFAAWPQLAGPDGLPAGQQAFLAGYICHLMLDQLWIRSVFEPAFGPAARWADFPERLYLHNVLRAHLDQELLPALSPDLAGQMRAAAPRGWLPFVADRHLAAWRDFLADQLEPGAETLTAAVFAGRMGRAVTEFNALLASPTALNRQVFSRLPRAELTRFRAHGLARSLQLIGDRFAHAAPEPYPA